MKYIQGNILDVKEGYILQQCNCVTVYPYGLSADLEKAFPGTCPYKRRRPRIEHTNVARMEDRGVPGTLCIIGSQPDSQPSIISLFAQYCPGGAGNASYLARDAKVDDSAEAREKYFGECLSELYDYFSGTREKVKLAIPFKIGCGLAKGNWQNYEKMLIMFEKKMKNSGIDLEMLIYCYK